MIIYLSRDLAALDRRDITRLPQLSHVASNSTSTVDFASCRHEQTKHHYRDVTMLYHDDVTFETLRISEILRWTR